MSNSSPAGARERAGAAADTRARQPHVITALALALVLWASWTVATYFFEGRILTLLRPDAVGARILYLLVANIAIGIGGAGLLLRRLIRTRVTTARQIGFRFRALTLLAGGVIGFALFMVQRPPTLALVVLLNAFAQVLLVSIAEVLVCWSVVGVAIEAALSPRLARWATGLAGLDAALLFGVYHYAHSPPFNSAAMVALLTGVGLATGVFFFLSRDVYGTIVFHNFMATLGVLRALAEAGRLDAYAAPQPALIGSAVIGVTALIAAHIFWVSARSADRNRQSGR